MGLRVAKLLGSALWACVLGNGGSEEATRKCCELFGGLRSLRVLVCESQAYEVAGWGPP